MGFNSALKALNNHDINNVRRFRKNNNGIKSVSKLSRHLNNHDINSDSRMSKKMTMALTSLVGCTTIKQ
jgi:hypothetical protein